MSAISESFGDTALTPAELAPTGSETPRLVPSEIKALWTLLAIAPVLLAPLAPGVNLIAMLAATAVGITGAVLLAASLSTTALRLGIGSVPRLRAAFGARGALLALALRAIVGVALAAAWLTTLAQWIERLAQQLTPALHQVLPARFSHEFAPTCAFACLAVIVLCSIATTAGCTRRLARDLRVFVVSGFVLTLALTAFAVVQAGPAALAMQLPQHMPWHEFIVRATEVAVLALPGALGVGDWLRYQRGAGWRDETTRGISSAVAAAVVLTFAQATWTHASTMMRGHADGHPIPDAAAFGGVAAAGGAVALLVVCGVGLVSLIGLYGPGLALTGTWPYPRRWRKLTLFLGLTVLALATLGWRDPSMALSTPLLLCSLLVGLSGIALGDAVLRRGKIFGEELYLFRSDYAGPLGVSLAGVIALTFALLTHPLLASYFSSERYLAPLRALTPDGNLGALLLSFVTGAAGYLVLSIVGRTARWAIARLVVGMREWRARRRAAAEAAARAAACADGEEPTNPGFLYDPTSDPSGTDDKSGKD